MSGCNKVSRRRNPSRNLCLHSMMRSKILQHIDVNEMEKMWDECSDKDITITERTPQRASSPSLNLVRQPFWGFLTAPKPVCMERKHVRKHVIVRQHVSHFTELTSGIPCHEQVFTRERLLLFLECSSDVPSCTQLARTVSRRQEWAGDYVTGSHESQSADTAGYLSNTLCLNCYYFQ